MRKVIIPLSLLVVCIVVFASFNPVIGFFSMKNSECSNSPLFAIRIQRVQSLQPSSLTSQFLGKNATVDIFLPPRHIIKKDMLWELSKVNVQKKFGNLDHIVLDKWHFALQIAENNLPVINRMIREDSVQIRNLIQKYLQLPENELQQVFLSKLNEINLQDYGVLSFLSPTIVTGETANITTGPICNITSGPICSITSQPICDLTSQPICSLITLTPPCLTLMGLRCPTAGLKCDTPTTGVICGFLSKLGPLLKAIAVILVIALILFIPAIILVSILNVDACTEFRNKITYMFNCSTPE